VRFELISPAVGLQRLRPRLEGNLPQPERVRDDWTGKPQPLLPRRAAEQRMASLGAENGISVAVARCFAFVGTYLPRNQHFAIGNFLADGLAGRAITVNARRPVYRSYMHADDLVRWLMTIAHNADTQCSIYNVGSDQAFTIGDVARKVAERFGLQADVPDFESNDADRYVPSIQRARHRLGLSLRLDLNSALDDVVLRLTKAV